MQKSIPGPTASPPVAAAPARASSGGSSGGTLESLWRDLMDNKTDWWDPNWQKKLDPEANFNMNGPDYKRRSDGKGLWLSKKDGSVLIPNWFVCPFTGKDSNELTGISATIRGLPPGIHCRGSYPSSRRSNRRCGGQLPGRGCPQEMVVDD